MKSHQKLICYAKAFIYQPSKDDEAKRIKYTDIIGCQLWSDCIELSFSSVRKTGIKPYLHKGHLEYKRETFYEAIPNLKIPHPEGMILYKFLQKKGKIEIKEETPTKPVQQLSLGF